MIDLSKTIIPKSDQLNADDLIGSSKTITIREVRAGTEEMQPVSIYFYGDNNKPYKPCKSMRRLLIQVWGVDGSKYIGKSLTIYRDESVSFGGVEVGGIRISHVSHIATEQKVLITVSKSKRRPVTVLPLVKKKISDIEAAKKAVRNDPKKYVDIVCAYELSEEEIEMFNQIIKENAK